MNMKEDTKERIIDMLVAFGLVSLPFVAGLLFGILITILFLL